MHRSRILPAAACLWGSLAITAGATERAYVDHLAFALPIVRESGSYYAPAGDFDGDGRTDVFGLFVRNARTTWEISSAGSGTFEPVNGVAVSPADLRFGDFDGDGRTDVFHVSAGQWQFAAAARGRWQPLARSAVPIADLRFGDFDGDGRTDVFQVTRDGQWQMAAGGRGAWQNLMRADVPLGALRFGDFDGDGRTDVFRVADRGQWQYAAAGRAAWKNLGRFSADVATLRFVDVDGDGRTDVFSSTGRQWQFSPGGAGAWQGLAAARETVDALRFGDFDGDRRVDAFTVRPTGSALEWLYAADGRRAWARLNLIGAAPPTSPVPTPEPAATPDPRGQPAPPPLGPAPAPSGGGTAGYGPVVLLPVYRAVDGPSRCMVTVRETATCAESGGRSRADIAAFIRARQNERMADCCQAIQEAQARFGNPSCPVVNAGVRAQNACP